MPRLTAHIKSTKAARELHELLASDEAELADYEEMMGYTDCPQGCYVEPDGWCSHNYESAGLSAGLI